MMDDSTVVILIRDSDPLCISKDRLIRDSSVFRYLVEELTQTEIEMGDFDPDTVILFFTILDDRSVDKIEDFHFRELHKLSVVFNVVWLATNCKGWLKSTAEQATDYESKLFVFEECRFIKKTWFGLSAEKKKILDRHMFSLLFNLSRKENTDFIEKYTHCLDKLGTDQLDMILIIAGSDTRVILEFLLRHVSQKQALDENTKHILKALNLPLSFQNNADMFFKLFDKISDMTDIPHQDTKDMFKLMIRATRGTLAWRPHYEDEVKHKTIVDLNKNFSQHKKCSTLDHILEQVNSFNIRSLFAVVDILVTLTYQNPPTHQQSEDFLGTLVVLTNERFLIRVSEDYVNLVQSAVVWSTEPKKETLIHLLELIKSSDVLCSSHEHIQLIGELFNPSTNDEPPEYYDFIRDGDFVRDGDSCTLTLEKIYSKENLILFDYRHMAVRDCRSEDGTKCGFIVRHAPLDLNSVDLCIEHGEYSGTGFHFHEEVHSQHLWYYIILSCVTEEGVIVRVPGVWGLSQCEGWSRWLPCLRENKVEQFCVEHMRAEKRYLAAMF